MDQKAAIKINNVKKRFFLPHERHDTLMEYISNPKRLFKKSGEQYEVLKDIDLEIDSGEFVGIMGRNGSGKSTLMQVLLLGVRLERRAYPCHVVRMLSALLCAFVLGSTEKGRGFV